jgi:hypothetical protein
MKTGTVPRQGAPSTIPHCLARHNVEQFVAQPHEENFSVCTWPHGTVSQVSSYIELGQWLPILLNVICRGFDER